MFKIKRRSFLHLCGGAFVGGAYAVSLKDKKKFKKEKGMIYRRLGRTGLWISEIGNGGSPPPPASVFNYTVKKGVNWFDTSSGYSEMKSEETYGEYLKKIDRKNFVVCTKMHARKSTTASEIIQEVQGSLKRLCVDTIDVLHLHGLDKPEQLENNEVISACESLKKEGKIRFTGVSIHKNILQLLPIVIDKNYHDVILVAFNVYGDVNEKYDDFLGHCGLKQLLQKAYDKDIGIMAMKVQAGGNNQKLDKYISRDVTAAQAKIMWALSHEFIAGITTEMKNLDEAKEDLNAVGKRLSIKQGKKLFEYCNYDSNETCRMCGFCSEVCVCGIEISDIQRLLRYCKRYDSAKKNLARNHYAALKKDVTIVSCTGCQKCEAICPWGVRVLNNLRTAHTLLNNTAENA
ncbi:MAG: aldo/keto reductase [Elusimicrobiota bacterium]